MKNFEYNNESKWRRWKNVNIKLHKTAYNKPFNDDKDYNNEGDEEERKKYKFNFLRMKNK